MVTNQTSGCPTISHVRVVSYSDAIDRDAEREGEAIEQFANWTERPAPLFPHVKLAIQIGEAIERGLDPFPPRNRGHFQKQMAIRAFDRIAAGGRGKMEIVTREDKVRRRRRRAERIERVLKLASTAHSIEPVPVATAAEMVGWSYRLLLRLAKLGKVPTIRRDGRVHVQVPGLVAHFSAKFGLSNSIAGTIAGGQR